VDFRTVSLFGIPSILSIFIARHFILPVIPAQVAVGNFIISKGHLMMMVFALLMLVAAVSMILNRHDETKEERAAIKRKDKTFPLLLPGLLVGLVTGLLGAGGGFLIIPVLVLLIRLPIKTAIGTSLLIIAINSTFGFVFSIGHFAFEWSLLLLFTALAIVGVFAGSQIAERMNGNALKKGFGWFVLVMSICILVKEIFYT
jgi:uncharacterized membrane protein YfcA